MEKTTNEKALLNAKEVCEYLGVGETKAREILTKTNNNFTVRIGSQLYANKVQLDKWLLKNSGNTVKKKQYFPRKRKKEPIISEGMQIMM